MVPTEIRYRRETRQLALSYARLGTFSLAAAFLRQHSPSADMRDQDDNTLAKVAIMPDIGILAIEPVGNYGVKLRFSDGHATGIFSWSYLLELCQQVSASSDQQLKL